MFAKFSRANVTRVVLFVFFSTMRASSILLVSLLYFTVVFAHVKLAPKNPALKNIGVTSSLTSSKRGLATPFTFDYTDATTEQKVRDCFNYAGNEILATLIEFQFPVKVLEISH